MGIVQSMKCRMGNHEWGAWEYLIHGPPVPKNCEMQRTCIHCQLSEKKAEEPHEWQAWTYVADDSCDQERVCERCQSKDAGRTRHTWSEWRYGARNSCHQKRVCGRCGTTKERSRQHQWTAWKDYADDSSRLARTCKRCKKLGFKPRSKYKRYNGSGDCDVCGAQVTRKVAYLVPADVFYSSNRYKAWLEQDSLVTMTVFMAGGGAAVVEKMRAANRKSHRAVCWKCIHLFQW